MIVENLPVIVNGKVRMADIDFKSDKAVELVEKFKALPLKLQEIVIEELQKKADVSKTSANTPLKYLKYNNSIALKY